MKGKFYKQPTSRTNFEMFWTRFDPDKRLGQATKAFVKHLFAVVQQSNLASQVKSYETSKSNRGDLNNE
jgi:putative lipoic acid-binding regulatory protein